MRRLSHSLLFRLMVLVLLALLPSLGLVLNNASEERRLASLQVEKDALQLAWSISNGYNELIEEGRQILFSLSQVPVMHDENRTACRGYLSKLISTNHHFTNIVVANLEGTIICDATGITTNQKIIFDGFPESIIATKAFSIGNYLFTPVIKAPIIGLGYPLLDEAGDVEALLIATLDLLSLNQIFAEAAVPTGAILTLRDRNGTILSRYPDSEKFLGLTEEDFNNAKVYMSKAEGGTIEAEGSDGIQRLYAFVPLRSAPHAELTMTVGIPTSIAFAEVNQMLYGNLVALGGVSIIALLWAWIYSDLQFLRPTKKILSATRLLASGKLNARTGVQHDGGELGQLALAFDTMSAALESKEKEWKEVNAALKQEQNEREKLLHKLIRAHEDERIRIARELHDETSQSLTALIIGVETTRLAQANGADVYRHLQNVKSIADSMLNDIHRLIANLRPSTLDDLGLVPAVAWLGEKLLRPAEIEMDLEADGLEKRLPPTVESVAFRVVQEALTNIVRHSGASRAGVCLRLIENVLQIEVVDNGRGYDPTQRSADQYREGFGLESMRERAAILDGELRIRSTPGGGTQIQVRLPIPEAEIYHD